MVFTCWNDPIFWAPRRISGVRAESRFRLEICVGGSPQHSSGRRTKRQRFRSISTPGSRCYAYQTSLGRSRWPSRDPIGEEGGVNVCGFLQNDAINFTDPLGLISYDVQIFDTGLQASDPDEKGATADYTKYSMPATEFCYWIFGNKYETLSIKVKIGVYYRQSSDKKIKLPSGRTVEAHENLHVDYYKKQWQGTENIVNQYGKLCFCGYTCQKLRDDLMAKGVEVWFWWAESQHALLDYYDYDDPVRKADKRKEYDGAITTLKFVRDEFDVLKKQFDKDCK